MAATSKKSKQSRLYGLDIVESWINNFCNFAEYPFLWKRLQKLLASFENYKGEINKLLQNSDARFFQQSVFYVIKDSKTPSYSLAYRRDASPQEIALGLYLLIKHIQIPHQSFSFLFCAPDNDIFRPQKLYLFQYYAPLDPIFFYGESIHENLFKYLPRETLEEIFELIENNYTQNEPPAKNSLSSIERLTKRIDRQLAKIAKSKLNLKKAVNKIIDLVNRYLKICCQTKELKNESINTDFQKILQKVIVIIEFYKSKDQKIKSALFFFRVQLDSAERTEQFSKNTFIEKRSINLKIISRKVTKYLYLV